MSATNLSPYQILPHGPGLQLLTDSGTMRDGWLECTVRIDATHSVFHTQGVAPAALGVEMMAQVCGLLVSHSATGTQTSQRIGVIGAVRNYLYDTTPFRVGDSLRVRALAEIHEADVIVCEAQVLDPGSDVPRQSARITLILQGR